MPLYWYTDKIIADKYVLIKPIPLKAEFESCEGWWMKIFGKSWYGDDEKEADENMIKEIERILRGDKIIGIDGHDSFKEEDEYLLKNIMEYLEEVK